MVVLSCRPAWEREGGGEGEVKPKVTIDRTSELRYLYSSAEFVCWAFVCQLSGNAINKGVLFLYLDHHSSSNCTIFFLTSFVFGLALLFSSFLGSADDYRPYTPTDTLFRYY